MADDAPVTQHTASVKDDKRVYIFDTTLRDGEQSPGAALNGHEKLRIAHMLADLGVDCIEAGFPISSPGDFEAVQRIAVEVGGLADGPTICALARAMTADIDAAWDAIKQARRPRIHTFIGTSDIHIAAKFKKSRDEILEMIRAMVAYTKAKNHHGHTPEVQFSPEDAGRTEPQYLYKVIEVAIDAGATVINIPDTVGYTIPDEFGRMIRGIVTHVPNIDQAIIATHCHNDLGLATANSLMGVLNGAREIECTINGIGERAGNAAMEEVVMALKTRPAYFDGLYTKIHTERFMDASRLVSDLTGMSVQPNKAIVGENAFAHESGIHQDGYLKGRDTYEIMRPESVGLTGTVLPLGPRSGRAAVKARLEKLGYKPSQDDMLPIFDAFKQLADSQKRVNDDDLKALVERFLKQPA
jgi:2-isopropylmalate synthase